MYFCMFLCVCVTHRPVRQDIVLRFKLVFVQNRLLIPNVAVFTIVDKTQVKNFSGTSETLKFN